MIKNIEKHKREHEPEVIAARLQGEKSQSYLKDLVYGAVDGAVTTFAVVSGVAGAELGPKIVVILGMANLLADGFSMAVANFLGTQAEQERNAKLKEKEKQHIKVYPEGEREEIRQIFIQKGFHGEALKEIVDTITSDNELWINTMLQDEHGVALSLPSPYKAGLTTFIAFAIAGFIPLLPFITDFYFQNTFQNVFVWSSVLTILSFLLIGSIKSFFVLKTYLRCAIETLLLGVFAAGLAYWVGAALKGI